MLTLHAIPDFASTIVHLALEECGAAFTIAWQSEDRGTRCTPAFLAVSPFGLVPALETPQGPVFETAAILAWLAERHPGLAPAPDDPRRGAFLSWFALVANTVHPAVMQHVHPERAAGDAAAEAAGRMAQARLMAALAPLDAALAADPALGAPMLAYYLAVILRWSVAFPADPATTLDLVPFPAIRSLLAQAEARPAARRVAAAEGLGAHPFSAPGA